jgi:hypothetical protein
MSSALVAATIRPMATIRRATILLPTGFPDAQQALAIVGRHITV